jgi:hypothetical protein
MVLGLAVVALAIQSPGVVPDWDVKVRAEKLSEDIARLKPVLDQLQPATWAAQDAPAGYEKQRQFCLSEIGNIQTATKTLQAQPEKLSSALDVYFRTEAMLEQVRSLSAGVRKYQNPAVADLIDGIAGNTAADRALLRQQIQDMAVLREKEMDVAQREAQRCRVDLARPGAPRPK